LSGTDNDRPRSEFLTTTERSRLQLVLAETGEEEHAMEGSRLKKRSDGRVVEESLRLARQLSRPRADPLLHLVAAGLVGFALALLLRPRSR
jgi:hypothetical protein